MRVRECAGGVGSVCVCVCVCARVCVCVFPPVAIDLVENCRSFSFPFGFGLLKSMLVHFDMMSMVTVYTLCDTSKCLSVSILGLWLQI